MAVIVGLRKRHRRVHPEITRRLLVSRYPLEKKMRVLFIEKIRQTLFLQLTILDGTKAKLTALLKFYGPLYVV
jgi:hypothetical protein